VPQRRIDDDGRDPALGQAANDAEAVEFSAHDVGGDQRLGKFAFHRAAVP